MSDKLKEILAERGSNYGSFAAQCELSQSLKETMFKHIMTRNPDGAAKMKPFMYEVLEMTALKISRICNGDPLHEDSWRDIAGYTGLAADEVARLNGEARTGPGALHVHVHEPQKAEMTLDEAIAHAAAPGDKQP